MKNNSHSIIIVIFFMTILFFQFPAYANNVTNTNATVIPTNATVIRTNATVIPTNAADNSAIVYQPSSRERFLFYSENAQKYYDNDFYEIANQFFKRALILKPYDVNTLVNAGLSRMAVGHFSLALKYFENAHEIQPNNQKIDNYRKDALWLIKVQEGKIPDLEHVMPMQATTVRGIELYYDGKFEESLELMDRSLQNIPYELKALIVGGHALVGLERYDEAILFYDRALDINPADESVLYSKKTTIEIILQKNGGQPNVATLNQEEQKLTELAIKKKELKQIQEESKKEKESQQNEKLITIEDLKNIRQKQPSIKLNNSINNTKNAIEIVDKDTDKTIDQINTSEFSSEFDEGFASAVEGIPESAVTVVIETVACAGELCFLDKKENQDESQDESLLDYTIQVNPQLSSVLNYYIPKDTKYVSKFWIDGGINDVEFLTSITYFIREQGKTRMISFEIFEYSQNYDKFSIPDWLKNNVSWWIDGYISDKDFINGWEYLINEKILELILFKTKFVP